MSVGTIQHNSTFTLPFRTETPFLKVSVTRGLHAVKLSTTSGGSGSSYISNIEVSDSTSTAPRLLLGGQANSRLSNYVAVNSAYTGPVGLKNVDPDVVILASTINDLDNGESLVNIKNWMSIVASNVREMDADFVGICGWPTNRPNLTKASLDEISAHLLTLAQQSNGAWVDNRAVIGYTYAEVNPSYVADDWHLTATGYALLENQIRRVFE